MRIPSWIPLAGFAAAILTGCVDSSRPAPTAPAAFDLTTNSQCQFGPMADLVRSYFAPADRPLVKSLVAQMQNLFGGGDLVGATGKGFDILAQIEAATNAGQQIGTPASGSALANSVLACMSVGPIALPIDFTQPLGPGAFAVRAGPSDPAPPVISRDQFSGIGLQEATWAGVFGQRVLVYGIPNSSATFNEQLVAAPYNWSTIPSLPVINPGAVIGFCIQNTGRYRIEDVHASVQHTLLNLRDASFFLSCPSLPAPLRANALGPVGGSATGFSDFGSVDPLGLNPAYQSQPSTTQAGQIIAPAVRVAVTGAGGTPMPQVTITLSLVRLSGTGMLSGTLTKETGVAGVETFPDLRVSQPGTYAILATLSASGFAPVQLQSSTFTVIP